MENTIFTVKNFTYKVVTDAGFIEMFGEDYAYVDNTSRILDAFQMYLNNYTFCDAVVDLWYINFDECFDDDYRYVPESAVTATVNHFKEFSAYGAEEIFKIVM